jgi:hypothetical protein
MSQLARLRLTKMLDCKPVAMVDRLGQHAGVTPAGSVGDTALFHHGDRKTGPEVLQEQRGPQSGEARPYNGDLDLARTLEGGGVKRGPVGQPIARLLNGKHEGRPASERKRAASLTKAPLLPENREAQGQQAQ